MNSNTIDKSAAYKVFDECTSTTELEIQLLQLGLSVPDAGHYALEAESTDVDTIIADMEDSDLFEKAINNALSEVLEAEAKQQAEAGHKEYIRGSKATSSLLHPVTGSSNAVPAAMAAMEAKFLETLLSPSAVQDEVKTKEAMQDAVRESAAKSGVSEAELATAEAEARAESEKFGPNEEQDDDYRIVAWDMAVMIAQHAKFDRVREDSAANWLNALISKKRTSADVLGKDANKKKTDEARDLLRAESNAENDKIKGTFKAFNFCCHRVVTLTANALANSIFHQNACRKDFKSGGVEYSISKDANDLPVAGLWTDEDPFYGLSPEQIRASFASWKAMTITPYAANIVTQREDIRYYPFSKTVIEAPTDADALVFSTTERMDWGTKDHQRTVWTVVYTDYDLESVAHEKLLVLETQFAVQARKSSYQGTETSRIELGSDF